MPSINVKGKNSNTTSRHIRIIPYHYLKTKLTKGYSKDMLQDLLNHEIQLSRLLDTKTSSHNWNQELQLHHTCLYHLQRERLIHLLVTITVTIITIIVCFALLLRPTLLLGILTLLLICLLIPYIFHYRKLENTTQRWYSLTNRLESKINGV